jgi:DNA-binding NtrC family response regulator
MLEKQKELSAGRSSAKTVLSKAISASPRSVGRILLIDDDPVFRAILSKLAAQEGLEVDAFDSMLEVEPFSRIASYRGVIFDFHLSQIDGVELATHLESIFGGIPMLLVSADGDAERTMNQRCPGMFGAFMNKKEGGRKIVGKIRDMIVSAKHAN